MKNYFSKHSGKPAAGLGTATVNCKISPVGRNHSSLNFPSRILRQTFSTEGTQLDKQFVHSNQQNKLNNNLLWTIWTIISWYVFGRRNRWLYACDFRVLHPFYIHVQLAVMLSFHVVQHAQIEKCIPRRFCIKQNNHGSGAVIHVLFESWWAPEVGLDPYPTAQGQDPYPCLRCLLASVAPFCTTGCFSAFGLGDIWCIYLVFRSNCNVVTFSGLAASLLI
jgi:hypothetical protein